MHYLPMIQADESAVRPDDIPALMEAIDAFDAEVTDAGKIWGVSACKPRELQQRSARGMERR